MRIGWGKPRKKRRKGVAYKLRGGKRRLSTREVMTMPETKFRSRTERADY